MPDYNPQLLRFKSMMDQGNQFPNPSPIQAQPFSPQMNTPVNMENTQPDQQIPRNFTPPPNSPEQNDDDISNSIPELVKKLYTPGHEISDKFEQVWNEMPQREKPSILRKIVAGIAGIGHYDEVANAPYNQKLSDWTKKLTTLQPLLSDERFENTNNRMMATNIATQETADKRIKETERSNRVKEGLNEEKLKVTQDRYKTYDYKARNPNHIIQEDKNGNLIAINPQTNEMQYILDDQGSPVKGSKLSDEDRINLQIKGRIQAARVGGEEARKTEDLRQEGRIKLEDTKQPNREKLKATPSNTGTQEDTTITYETNPDGTQKLDPTTGKPIPRSIRKTKQPLAKKIRMKAPNGTVILVPEDKVKEAKSHGAEELK